MHNSILVAQKFAPKVIMEQVSTDEVTNQVVKVVDAIIVHHAQRP